jgi:hydroxyproline O-arabinosyltransferase
VMEMYAFTISLYNHGIGPVGLHLELASQPPWDTTMDINGLPYYILHYTYGMDYTLEGVFTPGKFGAWRFDKRSYAWKPPPRHLDPPPDGMQNDLVRFLIKAVNEVTDTIPGWDEYHQLGRATQLMKYDD